MSKIRHFKRSSRFSLSQTEIVFGAGFALYIHLVVRAQMIWGNSCMLKSQHLMIFSFIVVLSFMYNNCASKMQFATLPVTTETAFGVVPGTTNGEDAVLTFNELNQPATIAFNDNYPGAGDSDYNDFVVNIGVTETYDSSGALNKIVIQYSPKYKVSGADHKLILGFDGRIRGRGNWSSNLNAFTSMPMFEGNAKINIDVVNVNHESIKHESNHQKNMDLVIFDSTGLAMAEKHSATITITDFDKAMNKFSERGALSKSVIVIVAECFSAIARPVESKITRSIFF